MSERGFTRSQNEMHSSRTRALVNHVTLYKLEVFCAIARYSSVTQAATHLGIAQPAVTAHLRGLEEKLGVRLVRRVGRHIELTEAGERVHGWARNIVAHSSEVIREISGIEAGECGNADVSASMVVGTYVLPDLVIGFYKSRPGARISLNISNPRVAMEAVRIGDSDFAVTILDSGQATDDLVLEHLCTERMRLVAASGSCRVGMSVSRIEMADLPYVTPPRGHVARDVEDEVLRAHGIVRPNIVMEFGHPEAILRAVRADAAVSIILETALKQDLETGTLRIVETRGVELGIPLYLIRRRGKILSHLQERLMDEIRRQLTYSEAREFIR